LVAVERQRGRDQTCWWTASVAISKAGAVMIFRSSSTRRCSSANSTGYLRHRIAILTLTVVSVVLSLDSARTGICAEKRSVPNIVIILADDKY
jgi:hypothetical protein